MKSPLYLMIISFGFSPLLVTANTKVSEEYHFYSIYPETKSDILMSLNENSPISTNGQRFHGEAYSYIRWAFRWRYKKNICNITSVNTTVDTFYTLPELRTNSPDINEIWNNWYPKLVLHEKGHHNLAIKTAHKIEKSILTMETEPDCDVLEKKANEIGYKLMAELGILNLEYDHRTNHGETEGASIIGYL